MSTEAEILGREILERRELRANLVSWARFYGGERGWVLGAHHSLLLEKLQAVTDGTLVHSKTGLPCRNLIFMLPPGSGKSQNSSVIFPPWALQRKPATTFLACSYAADLIESFSRECRNAIATHHKILGYDLRSDSRAVQEWHCDNGSGYRCAGVGAGIAGRRADFGLIDDFIGSEEDADSKLIRDKQWSWFQADFWPRLKPNAVQVIVANRRNEDDLIGRLLEKDENKWEVVKVPFFAEENDPLGRPVGERLWSSWFTSEMENEIRQLPPRIIAGLYQQRPAPEEGDYFKREMLLPYTQDELDSLMRLEPRVYGAADWAVSTKKDSNCTCIGGAVVGPDKLIYILPDIFWTIAAPKAVTSAFLDFLKRRNPLTFWSEKGHISAAWGPFFRDMMLDEHVYNYITEVTVSRDKEVRAQSIRGQMSMSRVRFPKFAHWWSRAEHELLTFPGGKSDDFVDMLAHLGRGILSMFRTSIPAPPEPENWNVHVPITLSWIKKSDNERKKALEPLYQGR